MSNETNSNQQNESKIYKDYMDQINVSEELTKKLLTIPDNQTTSQYVPTETLQKPSTIKRLKPVIKIASGLAACFVLLLISVKVFDMIAPSNVQNQAQTKENSDFGNDFAGDKTANEAPEQQAPPSTPAEKPNYNQDEQPAAENSVGDQNAPTKDPMIDMLPSYTAEYFGKVSKDIIYENDIPTTFIFENKLDNASIKSTIHTLTESDAANIVSLSDISSYSTTNVTDYEKLFELRDKPILRIQEITKEIILHRYFDPELLKSEDEQYTYCLNLTDGKTYLSLYTTGLTADDVLNIINTIPARQP